MKTTQPSALIVDKRPNNDGQYKGYSIELNSGQIIGRIRDGSANDVPVFSTTNVNNGCYHHIAFIVDRSTQTESLYIDNTLQAIASIVQVGSIDSVVNLLFGGQAPPNTQVDFFAGILDQIRMYNVVLSPLDVQSLFSEGSNTCGDDTDPATLGPISAPTSPVPVNTQITASDTFTDDSDDTHMATWNWGDSTTSTGTVTESGGSGSVQDTHTYTAPGVYTITLTVNNSDGATSSTQFKYVVVYDPNGGFVTGGGWIISPPGAYPANPTATGKANFGFNVKYHSGSSTVPTGKTEFSFNAGNIDLSSTGYNWLVVSSPTQAQFQGTGTINGAGNYLFNIAIQSGSTNYIRIQINDTNNNVVYDTQTGAPITASPTTPLGGGSFIIHQS